MKNHVGGHAGPVVVPPHGGVHPGLALGARQGGLVLQLQDAHPEEHRHDDLGGPVVSGPPAAESVAVLKERHRANGVESLDNLAAKKIFPLRRGDLVLVDGARGTSGHVARRFQAPGRPRPRQDEDGQICVR